ncbi:MAG: hypothetical protein AAGJ28_02190 [Pseudomonadota bacterium]
MRVGTGRQNRAATVLARSLRRGFAGLVVIGALAACDPNAAATPGAATTPAEPTADYATEALHFSALQKAGLNADYAAFAGHLKAADPAAVITQLQASFNGSPFDVYTQKSDTDGAAHRRVIELRSTRGRLYVFLQLDKVTGGWTVAGHQIGRDRGTILAKL